jgi:hypothetical protein
LSPFTVQSFGIWRILALSMGWIDWVDNYLFYLLCYYSIFGLIMIMGKVCVRWEVCSADVYMYRFLCLGYIYFECECWHIQCGVVLAKGRFSHALILLFNIVLDLHHWGWFLNFLQFSDCLVVFYIGHPKYNPFLLKLGLLPWNNFAYRHNK